MKNKSNPALVGKCILVVEDTPENLYLFRTMLRMEGATVLEAERAEVGIELAVRERPDLILMDMQMPGMDGLQATRALRSAPLGLDLPIIMVTASTMAGDRELALQAGCTDYLTKPVDPWSLGEIIASHLQGGNAMQLGGCGHWA